MKKLLIIIFTFCFCHFSNSCLAELKGQARLDSLLIALSHSKEDTNKVNLLNSLSRYHQDHQTDEGFVYSNNALALSEKLKWKKGIMLSKIYLGRLYWRKGETEKALAVHNEALNIAKELDSRLHVALIEKFIGQDYADANNYAEALKYFKKALLTYQDIEDKDGVTRVYLLLSWLYNNQGNYPEASNITMKALRIAESVHNDDNLAVASGSLAREYMNLGKDSIALVYLEKSNAIYALLGNELSLSLSYVNLSDLYLRLGNKEKAIKSSMLALAHAEKTGNSYYIGLAYTSIASYYTEQNNFIEAIINFRLSIENLRIANSNQYLVLNYNELAICYVKLNRRAEAKTALDSAEYIGRQVDSRSMLSHSFFAKQLYDSLTGNWKEAYFNFYKYNTLTDSMENSENTKKILQNQVQYEYDKKEAAANAEQEKKDIRQRNIRNSISAGLAGSLIFLVVVNRQRNKISKARKRSDELLLNILPSEVAEELKEKGSADAKHFDSVTVMFTDFKGFTQLAEKLSPTELVNEIHTCFKAFDAIIGKHGIEKIKTIGDSYMCAGGLPVANNSHATDVVQAATEIQQFMQQHLQQRKAEGKEAFEIRIGIHTGNVVAGIVGIKKFAYDIWGDTVNIASRMESSGEVGKVNISGTTYQLVKDKFNCIHRGEIQAKNKGVIDMYFVIRSLSEG